MRFVNFVNLTSEITPKPVRSAVDPVAGNGSPFIDTWGQVSVVTIFFSAMNNPFPICFFCCQEWCSVYSPKCDWWPKSQFSKMKKAISEIFHFSPSTEKTRSKTDYSSQRKKITSLVTCPRISVKGFPLPEAGSKAERTAFERFLMSKLTKSTKRMIELSRHFKVSADIPRTFHRCF